MGDRVLARLPLASHIAARQQCPVLTLACSSRHRCKKRSKIFLKS